eukprot:6619194-Ditylum_brightwellii.AAC.1
MDQWDEEIKDAFCSKSYIGWEAALKRFLTNKWQLIQAKHYQHFKSRHVGKHFVAALIQNFFDVSWDFWQHRNHFLHKPDVMDRALLIRQMDVHISEQHHCGMENLPQR